VQPIEAQVAGVIDEVLGSDVSPETRRILLSGENPLLTAASTTKPPTELRGLPSILGLAFGSPEFQRRPAVSSAVHLGAKGTTEDAEDTEKTEKKRNR
jgi:hypothetical protein